MQTNKQKALPHRRTHNY